MISSDLQNAIDYVIENLPVRYTYESWRFIQRLDGKYLVGHVAYDDQFTQTVEGLAFRICEALDLYDACASLSKIIEDTDK